MSMVNSIGAHNHHSEIRQSNRHDDTWRNHLETLRVNENRLTRRNVPRLLVAYTNRKFFDDENLIQTGRVCQMNCALRLLFNAPVFIRFVLELETLVSFPLISYRNNQAKKDLFCTLLKLYETACKESQGEKVDHRLIRSFGMKYASIYLQETDWIEQDPEDFCMHVTDTLQSVASAVNRMEAYSKAFEIKSVLTIDHDEVQRVNEHIIQISASIHDFPQYIDEQYPYIQVKYENERMIKREYELLPEQILIADRRQGIGDHISYPNEFRTSRGQHYLITGAVILNIPSHYLALLCRQDCVYVLDNNCLLDRFHIDYLPRFFQSVISNSSIFPSE